MNEKSLFLLSIKQVFFFWLICKKRQKSEIEPATTQWFIGFEKAFFISFVVEGLRKPFFNKLKDVPNFLQSETNFKNKSAYCLDKKIWDIFEKIELKVL